MTEKKEVLEMNRPIQMIMKPGNHFTFSDYMFKLIGDYLCVVSYRYFLSFFLNNIMIFLYFGLFKASKNQAGSCERYFTDELLWVIDGTYRNLFVDWQLKTVDWDIRGMTSYCKSIDTPVLTENPWSVPGNTYNDTYNTYMKNLKKRNICVNNEDDSSIWFNKFI